MTLFPKLDAIRRVHGRIGPPVLTPAEGCFKSVVDVHVAAEDLDGDILLTVVLSPKPSVMHGSKALIGKTILKILQHGKWRILRNWKFKSQISQRMTQELLLCMPQATMCCWKPFSNSALPRTK